LGKEYNEAQMAFYKASREAGSKEEKQKLRDDFAKQRQSFAGRISNWLEKIPMSSSRGRRW